MKEKPIIFSTDMVKAILDGTKIMTRRVIKQAPYIWKDGKEIPPDEPIDTSGWIRLCPYGQVGDRLWVREKYALKPQYDLLSVTEVVELYGIRKDIYYETLTECFWTGKTRPSIHMPRWASRILLEITEIRAERLQEITREDIRAEGIGLPPSPRFTPGNFSELHQEFAALWDSLNAKRGYSWEVNPFVWVIGFKVLQG